MFTGIVEERGEVVTLDLAPDGADARVTVRGPMVTQDVAHGDSIAVSGVCLTVVASGDGTFTADVMAETLLRTSAKEWAPGRAVNLERSVTPATRLGGHVVQGHIDGVGTIVSRVAHQGYDEFGISVGAELARYIAGKGAIAVDGISLTVIDVIDPPPGTGRGTVFTLGIIPETRAATTLGTSAVGSSVNIEVDVMAKYVERLLSFQAPTDRTTPSTNSASTISAATPSTISAATPSTVSAATPSTMSAATPSTVSAATPSTISAVRS